jgi:hypothetical protein
MDVDFSIDFIFFLTLSGLNIFFVLVPLTIYMFWTQQDFRDISLMVYSSILYTIITSIPPTILIASCSKLKVLQSLLTKNLNVKMLQLSQEVYKVLHSLTRSTSVLFGFQSMLVIGVVFLQSAFTIYFAIKVFILKLEEFNPKVVISLIWWIFLFFNPTLICILNELVQNETNKIRSMLRTSISKTSKIVEIYSIDISMFLK